MHYTTGGRKTHRISGHYRRPKECHAHLPRPDASSCTTRNRLARNKLPKTADSIQVDHGGRRLS